ncbi:MAG: sterol desaturase family protein [Acidobacteria bacterium]|nr:sterol desaturase family protein [Acidobacteriota bacterium]
MDDKILELKTTLVIYLAFAVSIAFELWYWRRRGHGDKYDLKDSLANYALLAMQVLLGELGKIFFIVTCLDWVRAHGVNVLGENWYSALLAFLGVDLAYYWFHRMSHRSRWLWAIHVSHHSSELMNFSTALRQPPLEHLLDWVWFIGLAWLGLPAKTILLMYGLNLTYQFFIHTELIYKLPRWIEYVLNTPSHHRVHHGRNAEYLDMNYGGVFIVWDRLFGSFIEERAPVEYGILKPIHSTNPFYVGFHLWADLWRDVNRPSSLITKLKLFFAPPGWAEEYRLKEQ